MKKTDKAFWLTIVPAVLAWRFARIPLLEVLGRGYSSSSSDGAAGAWANVLFVGVTALAAGYIGGLIARPQFLRAAANIAFGLVISYGIQNYVDYRGFGLPLSYFVSVPLTATAAALLGGLVCKLHLGGGSSA